VAFVTGESGIGKTTLVEAFLSGLSARGVRVVRGECVEPYGAAEAHLPVLSALGRLCASDAGVRDVLAKRAPTWLVQMPALLRDAEVTKLRTRVAGATRDRTLRELVEALEALTADEPLVLLLEDLHWSDTATVELLSYVARRREPAKLLIIGTYRSIEVEVGKHPLRTVAHDLAVHGLCTALPLDGLAAPSVERYVAGRAGWSGEALGALAGALHRRTEGSPLFMVAVVDQLVHGGLLSAERARDAVAAVSGGMPETVRKLIEQQLEALSEDDQRALDAASVAGAEFSTASAAAALDAAVLALEDRYARLARNGEFVQAAGAEEWPDGTVAGRFRFRHAMYQEAVYARLGVSRRMALHQRIGLREELGWASRPEARAAALAVHFEQSRDDERAVRYHKLAASVATQRFADREAIDHLERGLVALGRLAVSRERDVEELDLLIALSLAWVAAKGHAAPELEPILVRSEALARSVGDVTKQFAMLQSLYAFRGVRGEHAEEMRLANELLALAERAKDAGLLLAGHRAVGVAAQNVGDHVTARSHFERALTYYDPERHAGPRAIPGATRNYAVNCHARLAHVLLALGYEEPARVQADEAVAMARTLKHPYGLAEALHQRAELLVSLRQWDAALSDADAVLAIASDFPRLTALARFTRGTVLAAKGAVGDGQALMRDGLNEVQATGTVLGVQQMLARLDSAAAMERVPK